MRKTIWLATAMLAMFATVGFAAVKPGDQAPNFSLQDQNGKSVQLSDLSGKVVVLEWTNPNCPFVQRHYEQKTMTTLADKYKDQGVVWVAINSTRGSSADQDKQWANQNSINFPIATDKNAEVAKEYGAKTTPHMFVIDKTGKVVYDGAIDNDREGNKSDKVNYVQQALDELLAGKTVGVPETQPYGCGVKYGK